MKQFFEPPDMRMTRVQELEHIHYSGCPECRFYPVYLGYQLDLTAAYIYCRFPELQDRRMWVGNGQPSVGTCPTNPAHTGRAIDINYYTILSDDAINDGQIPNATGYRSGGEKAALIWDGDTFLPDNFHFPANYYAFRILKELGVTQYRTSELLVSEYQQRGYDTNGMIGDFKFKYNHHTHAHIEFKP